MKGSGLRRFLWWLMLALFLVCAAWLALYLYQGQAGGQALKALAAPVSALRAAPPAPSLAPAAAASPSPSDPLLDHYRELAGENPDMAGWIHIEGTQVDYPVMYTPQEPQKYLHRDFSGRYAFQGLPFLDAICQPQPGDSLIVYAHNMRSGQMFAALKGYLEADFRAQHRQIQLDTLWSRGTFEVIAVMQLAARDRASPEMACYRPLDTHDEEAVSAFNEYLTQYARILEGKVSPGDRLLTLSTCAWAGSAERVIVIARAAD